MAPHFRSGLAIPVGPLRALPPLAAGTAPPSSRTRRRRENRHLAFFAVPALLWYAAFTIGPLVAMFVISLLDWKGFLVTPRWAGLANYRAVAADPLFRESARNTVLQLAVAIPVMMPLAFMTGYYLSLKPPFHRLLRLILFTPALVSLAALGTVFYAIFQPTGLVNSAASALGLQRWSTAWLADERTALGVVIIVNLWSGIGFTAVLFSARLTSVGQELYEAAELDGCGHWRKMWRIGYPVTVDYFGVLTMLQFLWNLFASAGLVLLLTKGGPGSSTFTLSFLVYEKAFVQSQVGYSQVVGVVLFAIGMGGLVAIRRTFRPQC